MLKEKETVYLTSDLAKGWAKRGEPTSQLGAIYKITSLGTFLKNVASYISETGALTSHDPAELPLQAGDILVCVQNRLNDSGRIWHGQCEYVRANVINGDTLVPLDGIAIRTYNPLESKIHAGVTTMGVLPADAFADFIENLPARPDFLPRDPREEYVSIMS